MGHNTDYSQIWRNGSVGLSLYEIMRALNENTMDLGSLCTSEGINIWAKFKPFRSSVLTSVDAATFEQARKAANYGISIPGYTTVQACLNKAKTVGEGNLAWSLDKPRGARSFEYFRALDFSSAANAAETHCDGYVSHGNPTDEYNIYGADSVPARSKYLIDPSLFWGDDTKILKQFCLGRADFTNLAGRKIGFAIRKSGTTDITCFTLDQRDTVPMPYVDTTYECCFFYAPGTIEETNNPPEQISKYYLLPKPYFELKTNAGLGISVTGKDLIVATDKSSFQFTPVVKCDGRARTLTEVRFLYRKQGNYVRNDTTYKWTFTENASALLDDNEDDFDDFKDIPQALQEGTNSFNMTGQGQGLEGVVRIDANPYLLTGSALIVTFKYGAVRYAFEVGLRFPADTSGGIGEPDPTTPGELDSGGTEFEGGDDREEATEETP